MKSKAMTIILLLIVGSFLANVYAQEHILAFIKKCVSIESVDMTSIRSKGEESLITVSFKNNEALVNEFLAAIKADEAEATDIIERKIKGKMVPTMITFSDVAFSFHVSDEGDVIITQMAGNKVRRKISQKEANAKTD
jgi:hypothetical protein